MNKRLVIAVIAIVLVCISLLAAWYFLMFVPNQRRQSINSFESCVKAYPVITLQFPPRCTTPDGRVFVSEPTPTKIGMPNPASVNCVDKGGTLKIIDESAGQVGMCTLPSGKVCEEWALFRGECR